MCFPQGEEGTTFVRFGFLLKNSEEVLREESPVLGLDAVSAAELEAGIN